MKSFFLNTGLLIFVFAHFTFCQEQIRGRIEGTISNIEDGKPLYGVNVIVRGSFIGTTSDINGKFILSKLPLGVYELTFSMVGYIPKTIKVDLSSAQGEVVNVALEPTAIQTSPVVVTASKREQSLLEVPMSVSVIDNSAISYRNITTIDNALRYTPGINVIRSQVNIRGSTGFSYGVGSRVLLMMDGLPFLSGDTEEIIWESVPTGNIERVEVVKGAGSALYGSSALGGVINVITKKPSEKPETQIRLYAGFYDMPGYSNWSDWADKTHFLTGLNVNHQQRLGQFFVVTGGSRTLDDGYRRNDYWKRWNIWTRLGYDFSPYQSFDLSFSLLDQRRGNFLWWKDFDNAFEPPDDELTQSVKSLRWNLSGGYKQFVSDVFFYTIRASWYKTQWKDNIPPGSNNSGTSSHSDFFTGEIQTNYQMSDRNIITSGISGIVNRVRAESIFGTHSSIGGAIYAQDEISMFEPLRITLGGRYDIQQLKNAKTVSQFNPKFGSTYKFSSMISFRGSIGRAFRAPSVAEVFTKTSTGGLTILPNPELKPEKSWSYEVGAIFNPFNFLAIDASVFQNDFWDLIEPTFITSGVQFQNVTRARIKGIEFDLNLDLFERSFLTQFSYTYTFPKNITAGDLLKYRSRHLFYTASTFMIPPVTFGIDFRYLSKMERIDEEFGIIVPDVEKRVPIYLLDLRTSLDWNFINLPLVISFQVNNILQYYYVELIGNMGPVRNYVFTIESKI